MKYIWQIATAVLIVLLFASIQTCSRNISLSDDNAAALTDTVKHYKNSLGSITASINTLQLDKKQLQDLVINKDAELKALAAEFSKVKSVIKYETVTLVDSIVIPYKDTVPCVFERAGSIKDKWYSFAWQSNQKGVRIDSLQFQNTATVITGVKRSWFLGKETVTTDITNSNPFMKVSNIKSADLVIETPWYKKWYVWLAVGAAGGFLLNN